MDIIDAGPKVPMRFDHPIEAVEPNLSAALILSTIPIVRGTSMHPSQLMPQRFNIVGSNEHVVVVRQNASGVSADRELRARA